MTLKLKQERRAALFAAITALQIDIQDREHALTALEVVYFGEGIPVEVPKAAKVKKTDEKEPRGSTRKASKTARKGRAWTQKRREKFAAKKAARLSQPAAEKAPAAVEPLTRRSAHEALAAKSQSEVEAASNGSLTGSLSALKLVPAIRSILSKAARPLTSTEIIDRLKVGGYQHSASGPLVNSVTGSLSGMGLIFERRAGRNFYEPIRKEGE